MKERRQEVRRFWVGPDGTTTYPIEGAQAQGGSCLQQ